MKQEKGKQQQHLIITRLKQLSLNRREKEEKKKERPTSSSDYRPHEWVTLKQKQLQKERVAHTNVKTVKERDSNNTKIETIKGRERRSKGEGTI